jgi:two-component system cell cycle sensor histidine kinase/response regulator CckA
MIGKTPFVLDVPLMLALAAALFALLGWIRAVRKSQTVQGPSTQVLRQIEEAVARETGASFFNALVTNLAGRLGAEYAFLAVVEPAQPGVITTLAACGRGIVAENLAYHIEKTPSEHVLHHGAAVHAEGVREKFPEDFLLQHMGIESFIGARVVDRYGSPAGVLAVMHTARADEPDLTDTILRTFALRAGAEVDRMRAVEAMRRSEEKLSKVYSSSPDAITLSSLAESRYLDINEGFTRMFGYERADVIGRAALDLGVWRTPAQRGELVASLGASGAVRNMEAELVSRDGSVRTCLISADVIEIDGRVCMLAVTRDITDRKAAEVALRASERRYRALFEESQALNLVVARDGTLVDVNDAVTRTYEIDRAELIGRSALDFVEANHRPRLAAAIESLFSGGPAVPCHVQVVAGDKTRTLMLAFGGLEESGERPTMLVNALDVTEWHRAKQERDRLEEQVRHSQKMDAIGRLAGGIAHDFNNILQLIHGHLTLALEHLPVESAAASAVLAALKTVVRACGLTRQLLTFSRRDPLQLGALDLAAEIADLATLMRGVIGEHIVLQVTSEQDLPAVRMDRTQLEQIVLNLSINARDAMPSGGRIEIDTRRADISLDFCSTHPGFREGAFVCLSVSDSGAGIPREVQSRIFEPFFTTKESGRGTGLGLATVYGIVQRCGGFLDVMSEVGAGTTMRVLLPIAGGPAGRDLSVAASEAGIGSADTILVAEADRAVGDLICGTLERAGYQVLRALDGRGAQTLFEAHTDAIALVLIDAAMPKAQKHALFDVVTTTSPNLPILFSTGYAEHPLSGNEAAQHYPVLMKPYLPSELLRRVRELIDRARGEASLGYNTGPIDDPRR